MSDTACEHLNLLLTESTGLELGRGEDEPQAIDGGQVEVGEGDDVPPDPLELALLGLLQFADVGQQSSVDGLSIVLVQHAGAC